MPMLSDPQIFGFGDVHPFGFMLQYLTDRASLHSVPLSDVLLPCIWILQMIHAYCLAIDVEQPLFSLFCPFRIA